MVVYSPWGHPRSHGNWDLCVCPQAPTKTETLSTHDTLCSVIWLSYQRTHSLLYCSTRVCLLHFFVGQACAKLLGFEALIGYGLEKWPKYRYCIGIGYEIARECISILVLFRNNELIDIGFDIDFEFLHVGILHQFRANILEGLCSKILVLKSILFRNISQN